MKTSENKLLPRPIQRTTGTDPDTTLKAIGQQMKKKDKLTTKSFERCAPYLLACALVFLTILSTAAQSIKNEVQILEGKYGIEKKQVIEQAMGLSVQEASDFWPIYEDYEDKRRVLGEERLFLIYDYVIAYPSLTGAKASEIVSRCFKNDEALAKLRKQYYKKVKKALSPLQASQFVQVEDHLENVVRIQMQNQLPFIGEVPSISNIKKK